ncbi:hypothetical protein CRENBAI_002786 [Crenichthys baileyi]|uniref:Uncharacterized protein n=1 Tax=Crenichthys baileyi TaxID=28760 RepID=A0AAV9SMY6_9TELE
MSPCPPLSPLSPNCKNKPCINTEINAFLKKETARVWACLPVSAPGGKGTTSWVRGLVAPRGCRCTDPEV